MSLVRLLARPMLASAYIGNGIARIKNPDASAETIAPLLNAAKKQFDLPIDPTLVARATGVAQVAAGSLLAIGKYPRLSSAVLVGTYLIDVVGEQLSDGSSASRGTLLTRTSMLGGALLASVDTAGKPGLVWRAQHAAEDLRKNVERSSAKAMNAVGIQS